MELCDLLLPLVHCRHLQIGDEMKTTMWRHGRKQDSEIYLWTETPNLPGKERECLVIPPTHHLMIRKHKVSFLPSCSCRDWFFGKAKGGRRLSWKGLPSSPRESCSGLLKESEVREKNQPIARVTGCCRFFGQLKGAGAWASPAV